MPAIARASYVVALAFTAGCADPGVTTPTAPAPRPGIPQSLTVSVVPVDVPYPGGQVVLSGNVVVTPGTELARVPVSVTLHVSDTQIPDVTSTFYTDVGGNFRDTWFLSFSADLLFKAGALEQRVHVSRQAPPPIPESPPPQIPPQPTPLPEPRGPTPPIATLSITLPTPSPTGTETTLRVNQNLEFTATVAAISGDPVPVTNVTYRWAIRDGPTVYTVPDASASPPEPMGTVAGTSVTKTMKFKNTGATSVGIEIVLADGTGRRAYKRVDFTVLP